MDERLQIFQDKMEKSLANLNEEFAGIRAGRANPHVLDKLRKLFSVIKMSRHKLYKFFHFHYNTLPL